MKFLQRLERTTIVWSLIAICLVFFFLRLPSLIEPYWYGDEGIYEVIGSAMNHGELLYRDIWDNKPPLLYVVYALAQGDQPTIKVLSLLVGILIVIAFFILSLKLFNRQKISIIVTSLFVLLFATPFLEANIANAEDFILLPILLAGLLIYNFKTLNKHSNFLFLPSHFSFLISGLLLGIAFLFKIVAIFDFAAFLLFILISNLPENFSWSLFKKFKAKSEIKHHEFLTKTLIPNSLFIILGFFAPLFISVIYFAFNHALVDYFQSAFSGNVDYVEWKNNFLGIPQGWLLIKCLLLAIGVFFIINKRKFFSPSVLFISLWLLFSVFNAFFSGRPYTHYALVLLPSFCLFVGLFFVHNKARTRVSLLAIILILVMALSFYFQFNLGRSFAYYTNVLQFINGQKNVEGYQSFFDQKVPRDYTVASFIKNHTTQKDTVYVWGNNPQIYVLANKVPLGRYTVAYHILQNNALDVTQQAIDKGKPKYIIVLSESQPLPFVIPLYIMRYNISGAIIYERSF